MIDVEDLIRLIDKGEFTEAIEALNERPELAMHESSRGDADGRLRGATPLHWAAHREGGVEMCQQLLRAGADVNASGSKWWRTPLAWAADAGRAGAVRFLLENGADVNSDAFGNTTALHAAAQGGSDAGERDPAGYQETARLLIKYGVEINRRTNYDNAMALDDALRKGNHHVEAVLRQASDT
jgi:ankyrin repeat protein